MSLQDYTCQLCGKVERSGRLLPLRWKSEATKVAETLSERTIDKVCRSCWSDGMAELEKDDLLEFFADEVGGTVDTEAELLEVRQARDDLEKQVKDLEDEKKDMVHVDDHDKEVADAEAAAQKKGYNEGDDDGYERGYEEGQEDMRQELEAEAEDRRVHVEELP